MKQTMEQWRMDDPNGEIPVLLYIEAHERFREGYRLPHNTFVRYSRLYDRDGVMNEIVLRVGPYPRRTTRKLVSRG